MAKTLHSGNITFIDLTDSKKVDVHISSNLPTIQIYNANVPTYSPDWVSTPLVLTLTAYADSTDITDSLTNDSIKWYRQIGNGTYTEIQTGGTILRISRNELIDTNIGWSAGVISYICSIQYNSKTFENKITFARTDTGLNGSDGQDGTGVTILGSYDTLAQLQAAHLTGNAGDAYIVDGDLYVWAVDDAQWENVGNIQGPAGADGRDAKSIILTGDSQVFKVSKTNVVTPSTIKVTAYTFNTTVTNWTYSINGGQTFLSTVPTGVSRNGNIVTVTGSTITSNSITIKASDGEIEDVFTVYKAVDGSDGNPGNPGAPAPIAFLTNENVTFSANAQGQISGNTITSNVVAYNGTTKVLPTIGTITGAPTGMTITPSTITASNEIMLTITITNNTTLGSTSNNMGVISIPITSPVSTVLSLTWSKVNAGTPGMPGAPGDDAYTVILTNESNVFAGDVSNALSGTTSTQVFAYIGSDAQLVTITSVNGVAASTTDTDTGIAGLKFKCSALSGVSPTITFTCTTAFKNANGLIPIVLSVGGVSFTKIFTYSIAFKGTPGNPGTPGTPGAPSTSYWLVSSANVVQKTSTGTITVTPSILTFTSKSQTGVATPVDYACRWVIDVSTDGTTYTNISTSAANETSKAITVLTTYKTVRARMYMAGGTTVLLDEQIIPVVSDGAPGTSASLVDITPSALYFKSTAGKNGTFTPDYIYLYPRFQNATFSKWQYSVDGGVNWADIPASSGVSVGTQNSIPYTLTISSTSKLYTDNITSISFRCNTTNSTIYDTVSIAKIYDVVDLQVGGRNLLLQSRTPLVINSNNSTVYPIQTELITEGSRMFRRVKRINVTSSPTVMSVYHGMSLSSFSEEIRGKTVTMSFAARASTEVQCSLFAGSYSPTINFSNNPGPVTVGTEWKRFSMTYTIPTDVSDGIRFGPHTINNIQDLSTFYLDVCEWQVEFGNMATDWSPSPEDLIEEASNTTVMLSNEAHIFEADLNGVATPSTIVLDVIGFKGATRAITTVGTISGIPSTGMSVSTSNNNTINTKITIGVTSNLTSAIADYGTLTIPITVNGYTMNKVFSWAKSNDMTNLQIGGRNLLKWTKNLPITATRNGSDGIGTYAGSNLLTQTNDGIKLTFNESQSTALSIPLVYDGCVKNNETITLSFDYRGNITDIGQFYFLQRTSPNVSFGLNSLVTLVANETEWQHCEVTFALPSANERVNYQVLLFYNLPKYTSDNWIEIKKESLKLEKGHKATSWVPAIEETGGTTFQLYAPKGYLITHDVPEVTLQTFAYDGSQSITNATFKWYSWSGENWTVINNAASTSLTVNKSNVLKSNVYKCEMTYSGKVYEATATVEDKTDIYDSLIRVNAKRTSNNSMYWILYTTVYSEEGERDALLGPVSETAPASPTTGSYWYQIDPTNYSITLKKYSGTAWVTSTDKQELSYDWFLFKDTTEMVSLGDKSKVKIVKSGDFVTTCSVQCNVFDAENTVLSRNNQVLNDPTDPIVSETAPTNPIDGQIWIKVGTNGSYMLSVWSAELNKWILSSADTQNKVYVTKPTQYNEGDLWIVDSNYSPVAYENGVVQDYKHPEKTMLMATATSQTYSDAHWVEALKYQKELNGVIGDMEKFKQFISIDDTGLTMQAKGANGTVSEFKTMLTNTELGFYQGAAKVAYINNNQLNISKAEITNGLMVSGTNPQLNIGNFTIIQETNGSLSIG